MNTPPEKLAPDKSASAKVRDRSPNGGTEDEDNFSSHNFSGVSGSEKENKEIRIFYSLLIQNNCKYLWPEA